MKKKWVRLAAAMLSAMLLISACGGSKTAEPVQEEETAEEESKEEAEEPSEDTGEEAQEEAVAASDEPELFPWPEKAKETVVLTDDALMNITLAGSLYTFQGEHPNGSTIDAVGLKLSEPVVIDTEYTGRVSVEDVHLAAGTYLESSDLTIYDGCDVVVSGKAFGAHTAWHLRDLVLLVDDIYEDYGEGDYSDHEYITNVTDITLGYYLDVDRAEDVFALLNGRWYLYRDYSGETILTPESFPEYITYYEFDEAGNACFGSGETADADENGELKESDIHALDVEICYDYPEDVQVSWPTNWYIVLTTKDTSNNNIVYATHRGKYLYVYEHINDTMYAEQVYARNISYAGEEMAMDASVQKEANLFLSNFAEQSFGAFSYDGSFDMKTLVDFAFAFARVNTPERLQHKDGYEVLTLDQVNTFMKRYTPFLIPRAESPYVQGGSFYYEDGKVYYEAGGGDTYNFLAIATRMERGMGKVRFIDYDVYALDYVEYQEQGIDKAYYELTAKEAASNPALHKICSGRAVAEAFTTPIRESFRLISNESIYTVKDAKELELAIGPNRTVALMAGTYNLTEVANPFTIDGCSNLILRAAKDVKGKVELVSTEPYDNVLTFNNCDTLTIENLILGHILEEADCGGNVIGYDNCYGVVMDGLDLYGCGAYGYQAFDSGSILLKNSVIHDCTYGCVSTMGSFGLNFENCVFRDCKQYTMLDLYDCAASFKNCKFYRFEGDFLSDYTERYDTFDGCLYDKETLEALQNFKYIDSMTMIP